MYADDVAVVVSGSSLDALELKLNSVASQLMDWFRQNGLILNVMKTQFLQFNLSGRARRRLDVNAEGNVVQQVSVSAFLGFHIDDSLTWMHHIDSLCARLGRACFALGRLSSTLPRHAVRSCYFATVQSLLQYGVEFWGHAADWERVFRMQKRAVRAIVRVSREESAKEHFISLGIMTLPSLLIYQVATYVWPKVGSYAKRSDCKAYGLRHADRLLPVASSLTKTSKLIDVMGPTVYNRLPGLVTSAPSFDTFKNRLRHWLIQQSFYSLKEFEKLKIN